MGKADSKSQPPLRITKVYTRTGDAGTTRLVGGQVLKKNHPRIEAYGTVDELSVAMGQARNAVSQFIAATELTGNPNEMLDELQGTKVRRRAKGSKVSDPFERLDENLRYLQNLLFTLGGDLATRIEDRWENMPVITADDVTHLERLIDAYNESLPPLKDFVLPGGGPLPLALHACRVICRRAERRIQSLADVENIGESVIPFVNRLSDLFFVLGRWTVAKLVELDKAEPETIWDRALPRPALPKPKVGAR